MVIMDSLGGGRLDCCYSLALSDRRVLVNSNRVESIPKRANS